MQWTTIISLYQGFIFIIKTTKSYDQYVSFEKQNKCEVSY